MPTTRPAGMCAVPLGDTAVCQAGTRRTHMPPSNSIVPPMFGSDTFSTPDSPSSFASSTIATVWAPVRLAMSTVSPMWSACPCVRKMWVGSTSPASTAAFGFPVRNGSISTRVSPSLSSKHAWPRKRISIGQVPPCRGFGTRLRVPLAFKFVGERPAHRDAHQHPDPSLLRQQRRDLALALDGVVAGQSLAQCLVAAVVEPAALLQGHVQDALQLGGDPGDVSLRLAEALGLAERLERGVDIGVAERALGHRADNRRVHAPPKLTSLSHGAGCGCKIGPATLAPLLAALPRSDDLAIVSTADFFTPIVDDPYDFGRIAATNALSDVYAMGGRPVIALNLVAFSLDALGGDVLRDILRGGSDVAEAAGVAVVGGHSIDDREPKYGMAVTGTVHPDEVTTNAGGRPGDVLVLTKPLGVGAIATAR